jgi:hypothetical protein
MTTKPINRATMVAALRIVAQKLQERFAARVAAAESRLATTDEIVADLDRRIEALERRAGRDAA